MKEPRQEREASSQAKCDECGCENFFNAAIADPKTTRVYHLHRCRGCGHLRWPDHDEGV